MFWSISNKCDFYREFLSWYFLKMLFYSTHYRAHASFIMALFISTHLYNNFALSFRFSLCLHFLFLIYLLIWQSFQLERKEEWDGEGIAMNWVANLLRDKKRKPCKNFVINRDFGTWSVYYIIL